VRGKGGGGGSSGYERSVGGVSNCGSVCWPSPKKPPLPESASELYRPSDRLLSAKLVPAFADRELHVVSVTDPNGRILGCIDRSRYFFFQVAPQLYSRS
jgi:hypothetical protein